MCAAAVVAAQAVVLALVPRSARGTVSVAMTLATLIALAVIVRYVTARPRPAGPPRTTGGTGETPSPAMRLARQLAQEGTPAAQIAERCDIPVALAELVVAETVGAPPAEPQL